METSLSSMKRKGAGQGPRPASCGYFLCQLLITLLGISHQVEGQNYSQTASVFADRVNQMGYSIMVRPILDQSKVMYVYPSFELLSITEVDDVHQRFTCNGFVVLTWTDELLAWDPADYGGETAFIPPITQIWKPRVLLWNTIDKRDIFEDDFTPMEVSNNGFTYWIPGSVFSTSCELDMTNFPFDEQTCSVELMSIYYLQNKLQFVLPISEVGLSYFTENGEWELTGTSVKLPVLPSAGRGDTHLPTIVQFNFHLKRKPANFLLTVIVPVVLMSFLNLMVFVIPVADGKIGYGMTVLLALVLSLTIVSRMLPRSAEAIPKVTIYLFMLLIISCLTVIVSVIITFLHHLKKTETERLKAKENMKETVYKLSYLGSAASAFHNTNGPAETSENTAKPPTNSATDGPCEDHPGNDGVSKPPTHNKYTKMAKYIDIVSFVIFFLLWLTCTLGFMLDMVFA